jgi:hypothetical protein
MSQQVQQVLALLSGGDLRSIAQSNKVVDLVQDQEDFDKLFQFLFHEDRLVVMRAAPSLNARIKKIRKAGGI